MISVPDIIPISYPEIITTNRTEIIPISYPEIIKISQEIFFIIRNFWLYLWELFPDNVREFSIGSGAISSCK